MDITLHIGAHRTGISDFQGYLHRHRAALSMESIGIVYPQRLQENVQLSAQRTRLCDGFDPSMPKVGRLSAQLSRMDHLQMRHVIVPDANIAGTLQGNLKTGLLYPAIGPRIRQANAVLGGRISSVVICPRSLENYWHSAVATAVAKGADVPEKGHLDHIAASRRGWRDVITEVARAVPDAAVCVVPFEVFGGRPDALLELGMGVTPPQTYARPWADRTPPLPALRRVLRERGNAAAHLPFGMGHWNPFTNDAHAALRELYADDMMWLTAGADGLATLKEEHRPDRAGKTQPLATQKEGHSDEFEERRMARPG